MMSQTDARTTKKAPIQTTEDDEPPHDERRSDGDDHDHDDDHDNASTTSATATTAAAAAKQPTTSVILGNVQKWRSGDVVNWAQNYAFMSPYVVKALKDEEIDGEVLLILTEDDVRDFRYRLNYNLKLSEMKKMWVSIRALQQQCNNAPASGTTTTTTRRNGSATYSVTSTTTTITGGGESPELRQCGCINATDQQHTHHYNCENVSPPMSVDGRATNIPPEFFKTTMSLGYSFLVTWITSFVMVIVHERVPDMKRYPPLPDIFLDNVPHIPWAFHMCEITGTLLFLVWLCVIIFHKYRMVLLRRFFALAGTVFLLRCVTMLITSLSVPGTHLQCNQADYAVDDSILSITEALELRISRAYIIWSGLGMSIQGVRTCGDYMFSGHTVALTLLNFFITEYTPRNLYFLHTLTWLLNMFGIFFILAAHEHYSIDVFVAFYITSRLFLYYHTLANNQALMSHDSNRTRIWFPMFSYFESSIDGIIPNEYDTPATLMDSIFQTIVCLKDACMLTTRRFWIEHPQLTLSSKNLHFVPSTSSVNVVGGVPEPPPPSPQPSTTSQAKPNAEDETGGSGGVVVTKQYCSAATSTHSSLYHQALPYDDESLSTLNSELDAALYGREKTD